MDSHGRQSCRSTLNSVNATDPSLGQPQHEPALHHPRTQIMILKRPWHAMAACTGLCEGVLACEDKCISLGSSAFSLHWLLDPVKPIDFFDQYYEAAPLFVNHAKDSYFAGLPGLDAIDELLATTVSSRLRSTSRRSIVPITTDSRWSLTRCTAARRQ